MQTNDQPPRQDGGGSKKLNLLTAGLGLLAALLTLVAAYFGVQAAQLSKDQKQSEASAQSAGAQASALEGQNNKLQQQNEQLQSQLAAPTAVASEGEPRTRHAGEIVMAYGGPYFDLDAPSSDPQWGSTKERSGGDIGFSSSTTLTMVQGVQGFVILDDAEAADFATCSTRTDYTKGSSVGSLSFGKVGQGSYLCIQTSEKRYSAIKVVSIDSGKATIDVVTYDPPYDS